MGRKPGQSRPPSAPGQPTSDGGFAGDLEGQALPFLHRYMLNYGQEAKIELVIDVISSTGIDVSVNGITRSGVINTVVPAPTDSSRDRFIRRIDDIPISLAVVDESVSEIQGNTFVTVSLRINEEMVFPLCSGYVYAQKPLAWPGPPLQDLRPDMGALDIISGANPAAGVEPTITVPDGQWWRLHWVSFQLITDATVDNRRVHLRFDPDTAGLQRFFSSVDHSASKTRTYTFAHFGHALDETDDQAIMAPLPWPFMVEPNCAISTDTTALAAGDDFSAMTLLREKFYHGT